MQFDVREVGRDLAVSHVLEGSIRKSGNRLEKQAEELEDRLESELEDDDSTR